MRLVRLLKRLKVKILGTPAQKKYAFLEKKVLYVDISEVHHFDHRTGIQRVVRAVLSELTQIEIDGYIVAPIFLTDIDGYWDYRFVEESYRGLTVHPKAEDVFLGLDLTGRVIHANNAGLFNSWKERGVEFNFVVYDILPLRNPQWWDSNVSDHHSNWFNTVLCLSDRLICISESVKQDVEKWIVENNITSNPIVNFFHLGADIASSSPSRGLPEESEFVFNQIEGVPTFLIVGTLEPRKGHKQLLAAFESLWAEDIKCNLVIVGKKGWLVDDLSDSLANHTELNKKLFWLESISDEYLDLLYEKCDCLAVPSEGEGFGLPLIEAAQKSMPILCRDIAVFREVAGSGAYYFENTLDEESIVLAIQDWLTLFSEGKHPSSSRVKWITWKVSTLQLLAQLRLSVK
ncbi:hypothetical protein A9266_21010 [Vibrio tasmaniensis]|nr:hypothetical protein A9266_21010 [Vibrio tasmaniensis]